MEARSPDAPAPPSAASQSAAHRLAQRFNWLGLGAFSLWIAALAWFWARALDVLRPHRIAPPSELAWPWLAAATLAALAVFLFPRRFYRLWRFERGGGIYRKLGVRTFRALVPDGDFVRRQVRRFYPGYRLYPHRTALREANRRSIIAERAHWVFLLGGLITAVYALRIGWWGWALWLTASSLVVNLYPIFLQRYTRARLVRIGVRRRREDR